MDPLQQGQDWLSYLLDYLERMLARPKAAEPESAALGPVLRLARNPDVPVSLAAANRLPAGLKRRIYRSLIPPDLLAAADINPLSWRNPAGDETVELFCPEDKGVMHLTVRTVADARDPFLVLQLADNGFNGIDCALLILSDPRSERFDTDVTPEGQPTLFGTVHRNLAAEEAALQAGLSPAQIRRGLRASRLVLQTLESFLLLFGHDSFYVEPLTYVAAALFERRGFAYLRGRRLMERVHEEFQPGGRLHAALDGSTPFRQLEQWRTIRGRAWAIHDGILDAIDHRWDDLRMVKRIGYYAGVTTVPGVPF